MTADHINGVKTDDRLENLQWLSHSANVKKSAAQNKRQKNGRWYYIFWDNGEIDKHNRLQQARIHSSTIYHMLRPNAFGLGYSHYSPKYKAQAYYADELPPHLYNRAMAWEEENKLC